MSHSRAISGLWRSLDIEAESTAEEYLIPQAARRERGALRRVRSK
jgi:hypothetical protein